MRGRSDYPDSHRHSTSDCCVTFCASFHLSGPQFPHGVKINWDNTEATKGYPQSVPGSADLSHLAHTVLYFFSLNALLTFKNWVISHKNRDFQSLDKLENVAELGPPSYWAISQPQ